ncbi:hypothetical protein CGZ80_00960 [Rhodopirellula sp. MGV]|nr:hypothetical protein CGZ80_00960 [Rhodopirellula sp. MGV]
MLKTNGAAYSLTGFRPTEQLHWLDRIHLIGVGLNKVSKANRTKRSDFSVKQAIGSTIGSGHPPFGPSDAYSPVSSANVSHERNL